MPDDALVHLKAMLDACEYRAKRDGYCWICWGCLFDAPPHIRAGHAQFCVYTAARTFVDGLDDIRRPPEFTTSVSAKDSVRSSA